MTTTTFEASKIYEMRFIGDSALKVPFTCVKRTAKTATFKSKHETINRRIKIYNGEEYVLEGSYSMAPSINAKNIIK